MPLTTVPITARIYNAEGTAVPGAVLTFLLSSHQSDGGLVVPSKITATTGEDGSVVVDLWPNSRGDASSTYAVRVGSVAAFNMAARSFTIYVGTEAAADLDDLIVDDADSRPLAGPVTGFNGRSGEITLTQSDVTSAGGADAASVAAEAARAATAENALADAAAERWQNLASAAGAGLAGFASSSSYPAGSVGAALALLLSAAASGVIGKSTLADLQSDLAHTEGVVGWVLNDPTPAHNITYLKTGASGAGAWVAQSTSLLSLLQADVAAAQADSARTLPLLQAIEQGDALQQTAGPSLGTIVAAVLDSIGRMALGIDADGGTIVQSLRTLTTLQLGTTGGVTAETDSSNFDLALTDADGNVLLGLLDHLLAVRGVRLSHSRDANTETVIESGEYNYSLAITDADGRVVIGLLAGDLLLAGAAGATDAAAALAARNAENLAAAALPARQLVTHVQRPVAQYSHILMYGQSLSTGQECWPALSKTAVDGSLMLGQCVRPSSGTDAAFSPIGGASLQPLVAKVQSGATLLSDVAVAALAPGDQALGETPDIGAANMLRRCWLDHHGLAVDSTRQLVVSNCGVSGRSIEQLSKGASPNQYLRLTGAASQVKAIADGESASYAVPAVVWMQGEYNYSASYVGGTTDKATYKALLTQLRADANADLMAISGQARPPAWVLYQTGGGFVRDDVLMSIGMAQWEWARETSGAWLAGPVYPYTDKGGHLDPNGSRWFGNQLGKVLHRVLTLGQSWQPLSPRRISTAGRVITLDFHVPEPPLVFDTPYVTTTATDYTAKGFKVTDDAGTLTVTSVQIVAATVVQITVSRDLSTNPHVWYASQSTQGNGCLRDSDSTVAHDQYEYAAGTGQYAAANIAGLVGRPYPLHNWCIGFRLPTTWSLE